MESTSAWDLVLAVLCAIGFSVARFYLDRHVFRRLAIRFLPKKGALKAKLKGESVKDYKIAKEKKMAKSTESMWKLAYYATVEVFVLICTYKEPWFMDTKEYFRGYPNQELKFTIKLYYLFECGFYTYSMFALHFWETRRKDFLVMMAHHIITVLLISSSYIMRFFRIGTVILALHDASDVLMETAKICKYSHNDLGASVFFGLFAVSWFILRLIVYPFRIIKASSCDLTEHLNMETAYGTVVYYYFNTMLLTLMPFHLYWFKLIVVMIINQFKNKGKVGDDVRSDSDDD